MEDDKMEQASEMSRSFTRIQFENNCASFDELKK